MRAHLRRDLQHPEAGAAGDVEELSLGVVVSDSRVHQRSMIEVRHLARIFGNADVENSEPGSAERYCRKSGVVWIVDRVLADPGIVPRGFSHLAELRFVDGQPEHRHIASLIGAGDITHERLEAPT
jgi:hypothetical protein